MKTQINKNEIKLQGGTTGQALVKLSNTDYDYDWGTVSGGSGGGSSFPKSFDIGVSGGGGNFRNTSYQDQEAYGSIGGANTDFVIEIPGQDEQTYDTTADFAAATSIESYVILGGFLYLWLFDGVANEYRCYRYDVTNISLGGTLMTFAGAVVPPALGSTPVQLTTNGTDFYLTSDAGNSANDYDIATYSLSGTIFTYIATVTCGAVPALFDRIAVLASGEIFAMDVNASSPKFYRFTSAGAVVDNFGNYSNAGVTSALLNWLDNLYAGVSIGSGLVTYSRVEVTGTNPSIPSLDAALKVGVGIPSDIQFFNIQYPFNPITADGTTDVWSYGGGAVALNPTIVLPGGNGQIGPGLTSFFPTFILGGSGELKFDSLKQAIFQCVSRTVVAGISGGIGFGNTMFDDQGLNTLGIGFVRDGAGVWYTRAADGAAFTENVVAIADAVHTFRVEYDPVAIEARYYVDGILLDTITTNLPTAVATNIRFSAGNNTGGGSAFDLIGAPSFAVEI